MHETTPCAVAAAHACRLGHEHLAFKTLRDASFVPNEAVAAWRGFLAGLQARDQSSADVRPASPTAPAGPAEASAPSASAP